MTKYVDKKIKEKIEALEEDIANNTINRAYQEEIDTPEAKKQIEAATKYIADAEEKIAWLKKYAKSLK